MKINDKSEIANGVFIHNLTDDKFKTMRISLNFIVPIKKETVSHYAIIPSLITQATKECPSIDKLSKHLAKLYGASLSSSVSALGDNQILTVSSSGIADKFALEEESLSEIFANMICKAVFQPLLCENEFIEENFKQEKRQLLETIEADFNDKMIYVKTKLREIMFADEECGLGKYGNEETVLAVERLGLAEKLQDLIANSRVEILVTGNCNFEKVKAIFESYFNNERKNMHLQNYIKREVEEQKNVVEEMNLAQSKIIMGFRCNLSEDERDFAKLMSIILGGGVSSKFFLNIREKLSLCYYCGSVFDSQKAVMTVNSGIETENIERVKEAIFKEIDDMKKGEFTQEDIDFAKLYMCNSYNSVNDSLSYKETWYMAQILQEKFISPQEMVEKISSITKEQIIKAANSMVLDTVYVLKGVANVE